MVLRVWTLSSMLWRVTEYASKMSTFEGATAFSQKELRWITKKTGEHWLLSFVTKNDRYSPAGFEFDQQNLAKRISPAWLYRN